MRPIDGGRPNAVSPPKDEEDTPTNSFLRFRIGFAEFWGFDKTEMSPLRKALFKSAGGISLNSDMNWGFANAFVLAELGERSCAFASPHPSPNFRFFLIRATPTFVIFDPK
ncbi:MAG TPA: hypothetical protein IAC12_06655 [Candidatus Aphodovivens avistercoris]|nr:hypothetical protein [Candidatus Aphodovivens avistercoris]